MTGIKIVLSPPEVVQRFRDAVETMIQLHGRLTDDVRTILGKKAKEYGVHPVDCRQILADYSPEATDGKESTQCPVCRKGVEAPLPSFCDECGWDFKNDLSLHQSLEMPDAMLTVYNERVTIARTKATRRTLGAEEELKIEEKRNIAEQRELEKERFKIVNDDVIEDTNTGLFWAKRIGPELSFNQAQEWAKKQTYGGYQDWRLPSFIELKSLIDKEHINPSLPPNHPFMGLNVIKKNLIWSTSTHNTKDENIAISYWDLDFSLFASKHKIISKETLTENPLHCSVWLVRQEMRILKHIQAFLKIEFSNWLVAGVCVLLFMIVASVVFTFLGDLIGNIFHFE